MGFGGNNPEESRDLELGLPMRAVAKSRMSVSMMPHDGDTVRNDRDVSGQCSRGRFGLPRKEI